MPSSNWHDYRKTTLGLRKKRIEDIVTEEERAKLSEEFYVEKSQKAKEMIMTIVMLGARTAVLGAVMIIASCKQGPVS